MFPRLSRRALAAQLFLGLAIGCGSDSSDPDPTPSDLTEQAVALYPAGAAQDQATALVDDLETAAATGNDAAAESAAFDLATLSLAEYSGGRLTGTDAAQRAGLSEFLTDAFTGAGMADPLLTAESFGDDGVVAVVSAAGGEFVTATRHAGINIPAAALSREVLLVIDRLPDSTLYAPTDGPLPTTFDQYPLYYEFTVTPAVTFASDAVLGLCQVTESASAYYASDATFAELQIAHPDPANPSTIELLARVEAPFLDCDGVNAANSSAAMLLARRAGIGGRVRKFSPFGAVDPVVNAGTGQIGATLEGEMANDEFGTTVALSANGTRLIVGAPYNNGVGNNSGHARAFERSGNAWVQIGADFDAEAAEDRYGMSVAISDNGNRVAIGSYLNDGGGSNSGNVRVYDYTGGTWSQVGADIDGESGAQSGRGSGWAVAMNASGSRIVTGGPGVGSVNGHVKVYEFIGGTWTQLGPTFAGGAELGTAVTMSDDGNRVAFSYPSASGSSQPGFVVVHDWNGATWTQVGATLAGEAISDNFGGALSMSGDGSMLAVGADGNDGSGTNNGQVRVFRLTGGAWVQVGADLDGVDGGFGHSVSLSSDGTRVFSVGTGGGKESAAVHILSGGTWTKSATPDFGTGGRMGGAAISPDGTTVALGETYFRGAAGAASGAVRLYALP